MQYVMVKKDFIEVNPSRYSIKLNVFGWKVRYKPRHLSEGSVYDYHPEAIIWGQLL